MFLLAGERALLQARSVNTGPTSGLPDLTAVEAVAALCARNFTAVQYVTALNERYVSGGYSCNNPWITYNVTKVDPVEATRSSARWFSASLQVVAQLVLLPVASDRSVYKFLVVFAGSAGCCSD